MKIFRGDVSITNVVVSKGKSFAFGVLHTPTPVTAFMPFWILNAFDITKDDKGLVFDCIYIDRPEDENPCVIAIIEEDGLIDPVEIGEYTGEPGTKDFSAIISNINRK